MAAPKENTLFPPNPYHIPGYEGFIPQYNYRFGETFGKITHQLLTDPTVVKSRYPLLAPLHKQKFLEESSEAKYGVRGYSPGRSGYSPYEKARDARDFLEPVLQPKPPLPWSGLTEEELMMTHMDPEPQHHRSEYVPKMQLPRGYAQRILRHPASEEQEWQLLNQTSAYGQEKRSRPGQLNTYLLGSKPPVKLYEGATLPQLAETMDVEEDNWLPKLDIPYVIQQKVIPGYTGFIPRLTWVTSVNYIRSVKEAMKEFDQYQFLQRNPPYSFGISPQTYWPTHRIYTSDGLIPLYMGFVPGLRHTYALTYGNSTRQAYQNEQKRQGCAL